uniref:Uncharacterized protein n=1 Tax=Acrobeloides nanus TaxID=290746 RepID=A0A914EGY3_9BILA
MNEGAPEAVFTQHSSFQIQLTLQDYTLVNTVDETMYQASLLSLTGCYRCARGSEAEFSCESESDGAIVDVFCIKVDFYLRWSTTAVKQTQKLRP